MNIVKTLNTFPTSSILEVFWDSDHNPIFACISEKILTCFNVIYALDDNYIFENKNSGFSNGIQSIVFCETIYSVFIVDQSGKYINGFSLKDGIMTCSLFRGNNSAIITSLTSVNKDYLCVSSSTKTLHVFQIDCDQLVDGKKDTWKSLFSFKVYFFVIVGTDS